MTNTATTNNVVVFPVPNYLCVLAGGNSYKKEVSADDLQYLAIKMLMISMEMRKNDG